MQILKRQIFFRVVLPYAVFAALWLYLSDSVLAVLVTDPVWSGRFRAYKDPAFVVVTALLLYALAHRALRRRAPPQKALQQPERERAEAALANGEVKFSAAFHSSPVALGIATLEGRFVEANRALCDLTGYPRQEILGKTVVELGLLGAQDREKLVAAIENAGGAVRNAKLQFRVRDGRVRDILYSLETISLSGIPHRLAIGVDVTERSLAERRLFESEERLRLALDAAQMGTFDWDVPNNRITWSRWHEELWGFMPGEFGGTYEAFSDRVHPADLPGINAEVARCIATRAPFAREFRVVWPDGSIHWIAGRGEFTFDADGRTLRMRGVAVDITERKQTEEALRERDELLRLFVEHSPAAIAMLDNEIRYLAVSRRWLTDYGLGVQDIIGRSHYEIFPEIPQRWKDIYRRCLAGATERCDEDPFLRADGRTDWVRWEICPWRRVDGGIGGIIIFSEVITARKLAAQELNEQQHLLSESQQIAHIGSWSWMYDSNSVVWSDETYRIYGVNHDYALDLDSFLQLIHPDDRAAMRTWIEDCAAGRHPGELEFRCLRPDGETRWLSGQGSLYLDAEQRPWRIIGTVQDITERKQAQLKVAEYTERLERLSRQLLAAQEDERRRIARELHDELGQMLTAIKINLQSRARLKDQSPAELDAETVRLAEDALQQVRRLALALRPSMLDDLGLGPALRWMANQQAERGGFAVHFGAALPEARLAPELETACFRIAQEALTNIARHAQAKRVAIELRHEGDALVMTVQDDGRGFDVAEMRERAKSGGAIGVLGMQERAALLGGQLALDSAPGRGATLRVRLPWRVAGEAA